MSFQRVLIFFAVATLAACSVQPRSVVKPTKGSAPTPVSVTRSSEAEVSRVYVVVRGDTLYGIAFRNGLDYRDLARWNKISEPFTIYPGQHLRLGDATSSQASASPPISRPPTSSTAVGTSTSNVSTATQAPPVSTSSAAKPVVSVASTPTPVVVPSNSTPATTPVTGAATTPIVATSGSRSVDGIAWRWPTSGQVVARFVAGEPTKQGIGVAGTAGQAIVAAADGEVVYSGSGLIGYGELIIVRHSDAYLSAYGHNRKRLVAEGQKVKAGQQIAEMGRTGAVREMLHFEIRKNGRPVDPTPFLPPR